MDGRRMRWILCGGLILAGTGCKKDTLHDQFGIPKSSPMANMTPPGVKKSFWGSDQPQLPPGVEMPDAAVANKPRKTGPMPDFEAAAGDLKLEQAFTDPPPPNRDQLLDTARLRYQRALKADPKHKGALLGLARMHGKLGEKERTVEAYRDYLEHYPKDAAAHHEVAMQFAQWKDWSEAVAWCDAALKHDPENRTYRKTKGFNLAMAGRWEEAFETLSGIMSEAQARHNLAGLLDHLGHREACRQQLELAVHADPTFAPSREFLAELDGRVPAGGVPEQAPNPIRTVGGTDQ